MDGRNGMEEGRPLGCGLCKTGHVALFCCTTCGSTQRLRVYRLDLCKSRVKKRREKELVDANDVVTMRKKGCGSSKVGHVSRRKREELIADKVLMSATLEKSDLFQENCDCRSSKERGLTSYQSQSFITHVMRPVCERRIERMLELSLDDWGICIMQCTNNLQEKKETMTKNGRRDKMTKLGGVCACVNRARELLPSDRVLALLEDDRHHRRHRRGSSSVVDLLL